MILSCMASCRLDLTAFRAIWNPFRPSSMYHKLSQRDPNQGLFHHLGWESQGSLTWHLYFTMLGQASLFQFSAFKFHMADLRFQIPEFRFQISNFRFQSSDFVSQVSDSRYRISDCRYHISDFRCQISDFRFQIFRFQISDFIFSAFHGAIYFQHCTNEVLVFI